MRKQPGEMMSSLFTGATLGLFNLVHCAGMCGPLVGATCGHRGKLGLLRYQLGRTLAYVCLGALAGHAGEGLVLIVPSRVGSWLFAVLTGVACLLTARSLLGRSAGLGRGAGLLPLRSSPRGRSPLATLLRLVPRDPLALGLVSVFLPCGLLAAALFAAMATASARSGASFMLGFVTASGAVLLGSGLLAQLIPARASLPVRRVCAALLVLFAAVTVIRPFASFAAPGSPKHGATHLCH